MEYLRDHCMYTAIFGFFSFVWFGWAQENPRSSWRIYLGIASGVSILVSMLGVYLSVTNWHSPSALSDSNAFRQYLIFFYAEFIVAAAGSFLLIKKKWSRFIAPWIAFVVGVHFFGLKHVFEDSSLYILAILLITVSIIALFVSPKLKVAYSAITGIGAGTVLFAFSILGLLRYGMLQL
ncbi:hypothetical protein [Paenibacillus sp. J2TS4]|uniref:hypothetical protein n=1 Tax=Paenibacillus sp. J2TS4 TaxID=2807194 RepID=UPI001BD1973B|nr:hypothetical protein [Paenibacillus sp. J2TS4]